MNNARIGATMLNGVLLPKKNASHNETQGIIRHSGVPVWACVALKSWDSSCKSPLLALVDGWLLVPLTGESST